MSIGTILSALIALPGIANAIWKLVSAITLWYVQQQTNETLAAIADAAAFAARAQTDADRYTAAQMWRTALSKPRVVS